MNRNASDHFAAIPEIGIQRSKLDKPQEIIFTGNTGDCIPFYVEEILPATTVQLRTSKVVRLQTPITPFMSQIFLDTYYFFCPSRILWEHWKELMGENNQSAWYPQVEYEVPQIEAPEGGWQIGTIADYMGIPTGVDGFSVSALPFRAYAKIINEWFRSEAIQDPLVIPFNDTTVTGSNGSNYITDVAKGGKPFVAGRLADYFSSCLPSPQRGPDVVLPTDLGAKYPVVTGDDHSGYGITNGKIDPEKHFRMGVVTTSNDSWSSSVGGTGGLAAALKAGTVTSGGEDVNVNALNGSVSTGYNLVPINLWADTSGGAEFATTINQLRSAFSIQRLLEKDARGGGRYTSVLQVHFSVKSPDARLQRPEYLGGNRIPLNVSQVVQNSETSTTPQGTTAAYSLTTDCHGDVIYSSTEHGWIIGICVVRYPHVYQQGLERFWSRKGRYDFYWPALAHLGEQETKNKEIFLTGTSTDDEVFGYQERWSEYRYKPSRVAGEMRSSATTSLDVWHLADDYASLPTLSSDWFMEDKTNVDRVLAVTSAVSNQLLFDFYVENRSTLPMPLYSVPGYIDHF